MNDTSCYVSPLVERYPSAEMKHLFSPDVKFTTWRKLWKSLASTEKDLGVPSITDQMIEEMESNVTNINYEVAKAREKIVRHDVMAHVYAFGVQCPEAKGIIHYGATSCFVTDNTDILVMYAAIEIVKKRLMGVIKLLAESAMEHKDIYCLGYTHLQPASPTTLGKRECMWLQQFMMAYRNLIFAQSELKMLGCRGATGTSSTFMDIFEGDEEKVKELDYRIAEQFGFSEVFGVSGQTYPRILDSIVLNALEVIAAVAHNMAMDIRLMQSFKEVEEPFGKNQIGSSAMAYKRNPMRSERICSLARYVMNNASNAADTAAVQMFERTLDDSANKRISVPEAFLAIDSVLILCGNVVDGLVVNKAIIDKRLKEELPFMATEIFIMEGVKKGKDRQVLHEKIRELSMEAGRRIKQEGERNKLLEFIFENGSFGMTMGELEAVCVPERLAGRAPQQVVEFIKNEVTPLLEQNKDLLASINTEVNV